MQTQPPASTIGDTAVTNSAADHRISDNMLLLLIAGSVVLFHMLTNGQYGFHRDELDILMNARQLDWGMWPTRRSLLSSPASN